MTRLAAFAALCVLTAATRAFAFDYENCRRVVGKNVLSTELVNSYLAGLQDDRLPGVGWSVNRTYDADKINLLFADKDAAWDADACGGAAELPRCWSSPSRRAIICNPGMAAWLARSNYFGPPILPEIDVAGRFLMQSIFGHELAHLEKGGDAIARHSPRDADALNCAASPIDPQSEENSCDERGAALACPAARASGYWELVLRSYGGMVTWDRAFKLINTFRSALRDYSPTDDACTGANGYRSMAMRRRTLGVSLVDCLLRDETNPLAKALEVEVDDFNELEKALKRGFLFSVWTDPDSRLHGAESVHALRYDAFVLSGYGANGGELSLVYRDASLVRRQRLGVGLPGRVVALHELSPLSWDLLIRGVVRARESLSRVRLSCPGGFKQLQACKLGNTRNLARLSTAAVPAYARDGSVLVAMPSSMAVYDARHDYLAFENKPAFSRSEVKLAAISDASTSVAMQFDRGGLFVAEVATPRRESFFSIALDKSCIVRDLAFRDQSLQLLTDCGNVEHSTLYSCRTQILGEILGKDLPLAHCNKQLVPALADYRLAIFGESMTLSPEIERSAWGCDNATIVNQHGWSWVHRSTGEAWKFPVERVVACNFDDNEVVGYREGKLVWLAAVSAEAPAQH